jgi:hypothetical protein
MDGYRGFKVIKVSKVIKDNKRKKTALLLPVIDI